MFEDNEIPFIISLISILLLLFLDKYGKGRIKIFVMILFLTESSVLSFFFDKYPSIFSLPVLFLSLFLVIKNFHILSITKSDSSKSFSYKYFGYSVTKLCSIFLVFLVIIYEVLADFYFSQSDFLVFTLSLFLFAYDDFSEEYSKEIDIMVIFFSLLVVFEVVPFVLFKLIYGGVGTPSDTWVEHEPIVNLLLAQPLSNLLNILGYNSHSDGLLVFFENRQSGLYEGVSIAQSCSGIISIKVFLAFLISFLVLAEGITSYEAISLLAIGLIVSYLSNLFRMAIIVITGHYFGSDSLQFVHQYLGWLIFTFWIFCFYALMRKVLVDRLG